MPNPAPILSNPAILSVLAKHWHNQNDEPPITHAGTGRYLSPSQFMAFLLAARGDPYCSCAALLTCSLLTGIPAADLCQACWINVDTKGGTLVAFSEVSQRFECHILTKPACIFLDRWMLKSFSNTGLLFELYGEHIEMDALTDTLDVLGYLAGITKLTFDDLQRSHEIIALGVALCDVPMPTAHAPADLVEQPSNPAATLANC